MLDEDSQHSQESGFCPKKRKRKIVESDSEDENTDPEGLESPLLLSESDEEPFFEHLEKSQKTKLKRRKKRRKLNLWREDLDLTDQEDESDSEEIKKSRAQRNFESLKHLIENGRDLEGESSSSEPDVEPDLTSDEKRKLATFVEPDTMTVEELMKQTRALESDEEMEGLSKRQKSEILDVVDRILKILLDYSNRNKSRGESELEKLLIRLLDTYDCKDMSIQANLRKHFNNKGRGDFLHILKSCGLEKNDDDFPTRGVIPNLYHNVRNLLCRRQTGSNNEHNDMLVNTCLQGAFDFTIYDKLEYNRECGLCLAVRDVCGEIECDGQIFGVGSFCMAKVPIARTCGLFLKFIRSLPVMFDHMIINQLGRLLYLVAMELNQKALTKISDKARVINSGRKHIQTIAAV